MPLNDVIAIRLGPLKTEFEKFLDDNHLSKAKVVAHAIETYMETYKDDAPDFETVEAQRLVKKVLLLSSKNQKALGQIISSLEPGNDTEA